MINETKYIDTDKWIKNNLSLITLKGIGRAIEAVFKAFIKELII